MNARASEHDFLWGAATSSHQVEGNNVHNDWWAWEAQGKIEGGVRSGAAVDHWNRFREDLRLAAEIGLNAYRFSVEWSRIEPEPGRIDEGALDWYLSLIAECERLGLEPMLTLHHFTSPLWFAEKGGFTWEGAPGAFANFTRRIARKVGGRVRLWCTFNEPMVLVVGTYLAGFMPPAVHSPKKAAAACHGILRAHAFAYDILHAEIQDRPIQVGIAHNMVDFVPARAWHPLERVLAGFIHRYYNLAWLDAITGRAQNFGIPGLIPRPPEVHLARGRRTADFIGVNYYSKGYVQWNPAQSGEAPPLPVGIAMAKGDEPASDLGWAIHPTGLGKAIRSAARYGVPLYITENGIADRIDRLRPRYLLQHLQEVSRAIAQGVDLRGYFHWSLLDNFEWIKGFWPRFGLYRVDYDTLARTPTRTAQLLRRVIASHREAGVSAPNTGVLNQF